MIGIWRGPANAVLSRRLFGLAIASAACGTNGPTEPGGPDDRQPPPVEEVRATGSIITADDGLLPELEARLVAGLDTVAVTVRPDGAFDISVERIVGDSVILLLDEATADPSYLPSLKAFGPSDETKDLLVLLVPGTIVVPSGRFAGEEIGVSLDAALAIPNLMAPGGQGTFLGFQRWRRVVVDPRAGPGSPGQVPLVEGVDVDPTRSLWTAMWADDRLPIPLYFEPSGQTPEGLTRVSISSADSTTIWASIGDMEDRLGLDLFRPARRADVPKDTLYRVGTPEIRRWFAISLSMVPGLNGAGNGTYDGFARSERTCLAPPGEACERFGPGEQITGAVTVSGFYGAPPDDIAWLIQHELGHALGYGHSCFHPSMMSACIGPYEGIHYEGRPTPWLATEYDAAYMHWHRMIHRATVSLRPHVGIVEALDGERVLRLGKARVPPVVRCRWGDRAFDSECTIVVSQAQGPNR